MLRMPTSHGSLSSQEINIIEGSPVRPHTTDIMPQLDGPISVCVRRRPNQEFVRRTAIIPRGRYPDESDSDSHDNRRSHNR